MEICNHVHQIRIDFNVTEDVKRYVYVYLLTGSSCFLIDAGVAGASREIENIFENSDFILMLNQAAGDRQILAKQLNISPYQLSYVTNSGEGEGLLFYGNIIIPFKDKFDKSLKLYSLMTTKPEEVEERKKLEAERK